MGDLCRFRPRAKAALLGFVVVPALTLAVVGTGVAALLTGGSFALFGGVPFLALGGVFGFIAFTLLRGWFVIEVDSTRLALVGLGSRRVDLPWGELDAAGLIDWNGTRLLAVRPRRPWPSSTDPFIWRWDQERGLLLIAGLVNWSRPPDEMVEIMRTYAGAKWTDPIAEPVPSDQSPPK